MITHIYKDSESDTYGRRRIMSINGLGELFPIGQLPQISGGGTSGGSTGTTSCAPCPTGCRTEKRNVVYYARNQRTSPDDVAIKVARKIVKCEDVSSVPKIACDQSGVHGLRGLNGCSSCSGDYSGRM